MRRLLVGLMVLVCAASGLAVVVDSRAVDPAVGPIGSNPSPTAGTTPPAGSGTVADVSAGASYSGNVDPSASPLPAGAPAAATTRGDRDSPAPSRASADEADDADDATTGSLVVTVLDPDGQPATAARVTWCPPQVDGPGASAADLARLSLSPGENPYSYPMVRFGQVTESPGRFAVLLPDDVPDVGDGMAAIAVERLGAIVTVPHNPASREPVTIRVQPGCTVCVRVRDTGGAPLADVPVHVYLTDDWREPPTTDDATWPPASLPWDYYAGVPTNRLGHSWHGASPGQRAHVVAVGRRHLDAWRFNVSCARGTTHVDLTLRDGEQWRARVVDQTGTGVPLAAIRLTELYGDSPRDRQATADHHGYVVLGGLAPAGQRDLHVFVEHPGCDPRSFEIDRTDPRPREFRLMRRAAVCGVMRFADGRPVTVADEPGIEILDGERHGAVHQWHWATADGRAAYGPDGTPSAAWHYPGTALASQPWTLPTADPPASDARLAFRLISVSGTHTHVPAVAIRTADGRSATVGPFELTDGELRTGVVATLAPEPAAALHGTVTDQTGAPVPFARVQVDQWAPYVEHHTVADADGGWRLDGLHAGSCRVRVREPEDGPRYAAQALSVTLGRGEDRECPLQLTAGQDATINVTGSAGSEVRWPVIRGDRVHAERTRDGYRIRDLTSPTDVVVEAGGHLPTRLRIEPGGHYDVELLATGSLELRPAAGSTRGEALLRLARLDGPVPDSWPWSAATGVGEWKQAAWQPVLKKDVPAGRYHAEYDHPDGCWTGEIVVRAGETTTVTVALSPHVGLQVQVRDATTGDPVEGAAVAMDLAWRGDYPHTTETATTDAIGTVRFRRPLRPRTRVSVSAGGFLDAVKTVTVDELDGRPAIVRLARCARIEGQLLEADGSPAAGRRVFVGGVSVSASTHRTTDDDGRFIADGLVPGEYSVHHTSGDRIDSRPVVVRAGETARVTLRIRTRDDGVTVTVRVREGEQTIRHGTVGLLDGQRRGGTATLDANGHATIRLAPGRYLAGHWREIDGERVSWSVSVTVPAANDGDAVRLTLTRPGGAIAGRITDPVDPEGGLDVGIYRAQPRAGELLDPGDAPRHMYWPPDGRAERVTADGHFRFDGLEPGQWELIVAPARHGGTNHIWCRWILHRMTVSVGDGTSTVTVRLQPPGRLQIRCTPPVDNRSLHDRSSFVLVGSDGRRLPFCVDLYGVSRVWRRGDLGLLPPGRYRVDVHVPGYGRRRARFAIRSDDTTTVELAFEPGGHATVRLLDANRGEEPVNPRDELRRWRLLDDGDRDVTPWSRPLGLSHATRLSDPLRLTDLAPGTYTVELTTRDRRTARTTFEVRAGETTDVPLPIR